MNRTPVRSRPVRFQRSGADGIGRIVWTASGLARNAGGHFPTSKAAPRGAMPERSVTPSRGNSQRPPRRGRLAREPSLLRIVNS